MYGFIHSRAIAVVFFERPWIHHFFVSFTHNLQVLPRFCVISPQSVVLQITPMQENKEELDQIPSGVGTRLLNTEDGWKPVRLRQRGWKLIVGVEMDEFELKDVLDDDHNLKDKQGAVNDKFGKMLANNAFT